MRILVTGGSGYIGAHVARLLADRGDIPIIVDDFIGGRRSRVQTYRQHTLDLAGSGACDDLGEIMRSEGVDAVIHFAALKRVDESVSNPLQYMRHNLGALATVLEAMVATGVRDLVFSSSAAVYGDAGGVVPEEWPTVPVNPYGQSKLAGEWLAAAVARAEGLRAVSLRYFNVAGASTSDLADSAVLNLIPLVIDRVEQGEPPVIFGDDYPTPDGTCIRDFVHVGDVAEAHLAVLDQLPHQEAPHRVYNVGTGIGMSVREVIDGVLLRAGSSVPAIVRDRRAGDAAEVVADASRIGVEIGWRARRGIDEIIDSAWSARHDG